MESCPVTQGAQPAMFNDNLEGWDGVGGGQQVQEEGGIYIYTHLWLIHTVVQQKPTQHCKALIPQLEVN